MPLTEILMEFIGGITYFRANLAVFTFIFIAHNWTQARASHLYSIRSITRQLSRSNTLTTPHNEEITIRTCIFGEIVPLHVTMTQEPLKIQLNTVISFIYCDPKLGNRGKTWMA